MLNLKCCLEFVIRFRRCAVNHIYYKDMEESGVESLEELKIPTEEMQEDGSTYVSVIVSVKVRVK